MVARCHGKDKVARPSSARRVGDVMACRRGGDRGECRRYSRMTMLVSAWRDFEDNTVARR
jgi:hypothetical protein